MSSDKGQRPGPPPVPRQQPQRPRQGQQPLGAAACPPVQMAPQDIARAFGWAIFGGWAALMVGLHWLSMRSQASAIQQGAVAADTAAWLAGGYCIARAIDSIWQASMGR